MNSGRERPLVAIFSNSDWNIVNYRLGLIKTLLAHHYEVVVVAPMGKHRQTLGATGATVRHLDMNRRGTSPIEELGLFWRAAKVIRSLRPDALLTFTIKPNIYGSLAAHTIGTKVINNISGLGSAFLNNAALTGVVSRLYRIALRKSKTVFFQNVDDQKLFVSKGLVRKETAKLLCGSGIDLVRFAPTRKKKNERFTFLLVARLLWDKGVREFAEAARTLSGEKVRFQILGILEAEGAGSVPIDAIRNWEAEGILEYLGEAEDVRPHLASADCVVLPSYYPEGVPRSLLEASAMQLPVITTDTPGCREAVADAVTGFICQPKSVDSLVSAMNKMVSLPATERKKMGALGRQRMRDQFDEGMVHQAYLEALREAGLG